MTPEEHESICTNCGACCSLQVDLGSTVVRIPELRCEHLMQVTETETRCAVYGVRHEVAKAWCQPVDVAIKRGLLPNDCPYVKDDPAYRGSVSAEGPLLVLVRRAIQTRPEFIKTADWSKWVDSQL